MIHLSAHASNDSYIIYGVISIAGKTGLGTGEIVGKSDVEMFC